jgi:hypothetical protein
MISGAALSKLKQGSAGIKNFSDEAIIQLNNSIAKGGTQTQVDIA